MKVCVEKLPIHRRRDVIYDLRYKKGALYQSVRDGRFRIYHEYASRYDRWLPSELENDFTGDTILFDYYGNCTYIDYWSILDYRGRFYAVDRNLRPFGSDKRGDAELLPPVFPGENYRFVVDRTTTPETLIVIEYIGKNFAQATLSRYGDLRGKRGPELLRRCKINSCPADQESALHVTVGASGGIWIVRGHIMRIYTPKFCLVFEANLKQYRLEYSDLYNDGNIDDVFDDPDDVRKACGPERVLLCKNEMDWYSLTAVSLRRR